MKTCTRCGEPKSLDEFYPSHAVRPGARCKECVKAAKRASTARRRRGVILRPTPKRSPKLARINGPLPTARFAAVYVLHSPTGVPFYIGQTLDPVSRLTSHDTSPSGSNGRAGRHIAQQGWSLLTTMDILFHVLDEDAEEAEAWVITDMRARGHELVNQ